MMEIMEMALLWSREAEVGVLGALLLDPSVLDNVTDLINADSFSDERAGHVFAAISRLVMDGKPADVITVAEIVSGHGIDLAYVNACAQSAASPRHARAYAETVAEKHLSRKLVQAADDVKNVAFDFSFDVHDRIGQAQAKLEELQNKKTKGQPQPIQNFINNALQRVEAIADGNLSPGIKTRIPAVDRCIGGGLKGGKHIIIAARPSVGKSSLAEQICINLAQDGHPAAMFSMEMSCEEMTDRAICNIGRVDMERYNLGTMDRDEWGRVVDAVESMRNLPMFFDEQPAMTLQEIAAKARTLKRKNNIQLLVVDYMQLCGASNLKLSRHHQLEEISRGLKALAKQLDICIITLSQLNRDVEKRTSGRPQLSDLKESGAIEEDADVVMLMWRQKRTDTYSLNGLDLAKVRGGRTGLVALHFEGQYQRWSESTESLTDKQAGRFGGEL